MLCQAVIFIVFLSAAILEVSPNNVFLDYTQTILLIITLSFLFLTELFKATPGSQRKPTAVARATQHLQAKVVKVLDACVGLKASQHEGTTPEAAVATAMATAVDERKKLSA